MRVVSKPDAMTILDEHRKELLVNDTECVMCALAEGRTGASLVFTDATGVVLLDRFGSRRGHLLVVARRHVERATDLPWPDFCKLMRLCWDAQRALERALAPRRVYLAALGTPAALPMSYPHYHVHLIPIFEDDDRARPSRVFSWSSGVVLYDESEAQELVRSLRTAWPANAAENPLVF